MDEKFLDGSNRCENVTGTNSHSEWSHEGTDSVSQNVAGSVRGWTDRQGTFKEIFARVQIKNMLQRHISVRAKHLLRPISALGNIRRRNISVTENTCRGDNSVREKTYR